MPTAHSTVLSKLPALTFLFWVMKIAATTLGETAGDLFSMTMGIGYMWSTLILMSGFVVVDAAGAVVRLFVLHDRRLSCVSVR